MRSFVLSVVAIIVMSHRAAAQTANAVINDLTVRNTPDISPPLTVVNRSPAAATNNVLLLRFNQHQTNTLQSRPWFILAENGIGTNVFALSSEGHISIGRTNIFQGKDIDITRVHDRGETGKAWINIAKMDSWPRFKKAVEWWANCGTTDGVMELTWLNDVGGSFEHIFVVNEQFALCRYVMETNNVEVMRMQPAISGKLSPYLFGTAGNVSGPVIVAEHNRTNIFTLSNTGAITTGDPGGGASAWKFGAASSDHNKTNLVVMVGGQKYQITATPIP